MGLKTGTAVGPYEILAPIGAGGMGEVYRARDPRIGRDVAVKVLPAAASSEPERLRRFEQEARAAGALNHPNVLAVYDVGTHGGVPYIVSELLAGETLRSRMGGTALPLRKALDYAVQVARGLAAAHEKGIVHRDLKPENLFVTKDGRVKILDFGLAKLGPEAPVPQTSPGPELSAVETATGTLPGTLLGTLGYMSPEQVQGLAADARSDIFAFGAVLYEMITGRRAFRAETAPETLTAILKEDPLETVPTDVALAPGPERVLRHCLEKGPGERFQSAQDLAFALEALSGISETRSRRTSAPAPGRRRWMLATAAGGLALAVTVGVWVGKAWWEKDLPRSSQLSFRAGVISGARFSPDGRTIVYSAAWGGGPLELYTKRPGNRESRPFGLEGAQVVSVSRSGEVGVLLLDEGSPLSSWLVSGGTLARIPLSGGKPREMLEDTLSADWSPDGSELAVSRWVDGVWRLEYPIGRVLDESENRIPIVRVSPRGDRVAFLEEVPVAGGLFNTERLCVVDRDGERKALFEGWGIAGMAWSPSGREIWVDPYAGDGARSFRAVDLDGESRLLLQLGGSEGSLADVSREGRALYVEHHGRHMIFARPLGADHERNLSWRHDSSLVDISRDGRFVLFNEVLSGAGRSFHTSLRGTDGSPAVRLGEGYGFALSPDTRWALAFAGRGSTLEFVLLPTGAGEAKRLGEEMLSDCFGADWLPDSRGFVFSGGLPGEAARLYQQDIAGGPPRPLTPDGVDLFGPIASPDGSAIAAIDGYREVVRISLPGGGVHPLQGVQEHEIPIRWRTDGQALFVYRPDALPVQIFEVAVGTGRRRLVQEITQPGIQGTDGNVVVALTPDARAYAYSFYRPLDELYVIEGLE
jgi:serine/threonine protein kinase/dipeptidyl aminopeptidase/acylaminoacyl peptidase